MDDATRVLASKMLDGLFKDSANSQELQPLKNVIGTIIDCQVKTGERIKEVLSAVMDLKNQFNTCPAKHNDTQDHKTISVLEQRITAIEQKLLVEDTQRQTIGKMAKVLYTVGGVAGGAGLLKILEILTSALS